MAREFEIDIVVDDSQAEDGIRRLTSQLRASENSADRLRRTLTQLFAFGAITGATRAITQYADSITNLDNRIATTVSSTEEFNHVTEELNKIAIRTNSSLKNTTNIYARVAISIKEAGGSTEEALNLIESLNNAVRITGATTREAGFGLIQFSQAMSGGILRAEELNSILEFVPVVADTIAKEFDTTRGKLRNLVIDGVVTADRIRKAFRDYQEDLAKRAGQLDVTIEQAMNNIATETRSVVREFLLFTRLNTSIGSSINELIPNVENLIRVITALGITLGVALARVALPAAITGLKALFALIVANPIGALISALTVATSLLITFADKIEVPIEGFETLRDVVVEVFRVIIATITGSIAFINTKIANFFGDAGMTAGEAFTAAFADVMENFMREEGPVRQIEGGTIFGGREAPDPFDIQTATPMRAALDDLEQRSKDVFQGMSEGFADAFGRGVFEAESLTESLKSVARDGVSAVISGLIQIGAQMVANSLLGSTLLAKSTAENTAAGATTAAAWAPAAASTSLASFGTNAAAALFGIAAVTAAVAAFADGGFVSGPGGPRSDMVPARLSAGEFVVNASATRANRGMLEDMNAGRNVNGGGGTTIVFNVTAKDADSFRKSRGQIEQDLQRSLARANSRNS